MDVSGTHAPTWADVRERIVGLWSKFQPTEAERQLIADRLSRLNPRWLLAAVEEYRCESSSPVFKLAEVLAIYKRISSQGTLSGSKPQGMTPAARRAQEMADLEADERRCRTELAGTPRDEIAQAVRDLRAAGWIRQPQLPARLEDWSRQQVFLCVARLRMGGVSLASNPKEASK